MSINSPFDHVKDQLDNLHSQVKIANNIIDEQTKKIQGLTSAIKDYEKAVEELRFLNVGNKDYGIKEQQELPVNTTKGLGR